jgi:type III restriction enzyme
LQRKVRRPFVRYAVTKPYVGRFRFKKHYYASINDLKPSGEEFDCATVIDGLDDVKHWVRNAPHPFNAYRLPTSTDFFYPDFVAELTDGRQLVVEYKGEAYKTNDDSKEKTNVGLKAEEASDGNLLFLMTVLKDDQGRDVRAQILAKIEGAG